MRVRDFEAAVLEIEHVAIRIRAPVNTEVGDYDYERQASGGTTVTSWLNTRILPKLEDCKVSVVDGTGVSPNGRTQLATVRATYDN